MKKRESFNSQWGFILACIGSAVGMGNIWMFPTRVSLYGGGSFLIPYCIFVILIGFTGVIGECAWEEEPVPVSRSMLSVQPARQKGIENLVRYWAGSLSLVPLPWQLVIPWSWAGS